MSNKWIKLDGKKEPPAATKLALWIPDDQNDTWDSGYWDFGYLIRVEYEGVARLFVFKSGENEISTATHFMEIEKPKE